MFKINVIVDFHQYDWVILTIIYCNIISLKHLTCNLFDVSVYVCLTPWQHKRKCVDCAHHMRKYESIKCDVSFSYASDTHEDSHILPHQQILYKMLWKTWAWCARQDVLKDIKLSTFNIPIVSSHHQNPLVFRTAKLELCKKVRHWTDSNIS